MFTIKKAAAQPLLSRSQFLRGDIRGRRTPLRPPWSLREEMFTEVCSRCARCIEACPEKIIRVGRGGFPQIDFTVGECTFCAVCVAQCKDGALQQPRVAEDRPWHVLARISDACLHYSGVICLSCGEQCEARAIHFPMSVDGMRIPKVDQQACNGCGACCRPCPVQAINMTNFSMQMSSSNYQVQDNSQQGEVVG